MKALVKRHAEPGIWMEDVPEPEVGINDVLVKVKRTAICGTDIHIFKWDDWARATIPVPMAVGHEFSGEIVDLGIEVKGLKIGDRVRPFEDRRVNEEALEDSGYRGGGRADA